MKKNRHIKRLILLFLSSLLFINIYSQVPKASTDVMLQAFRWNSFSETKWALLNAQSSEIGAYFDLVWLPPSAAGEGQGSSNMGYHPYQWSNQNSSWGTKDELKTLISSLRDANTKVLADIVVNHRSGTGWVTFPKDDYGAGFTAFQFNNTHICRGDEAGKDDNGINGTPDYDPLKGLDVGSNFDYNYYFSSWDTWGGYLAARDLDHESLYVREAIKEYMRFLKEDIGYAGWRYDLVKGYAPKWTKEYNQAANAYISVGEYFQYDYDALAAWVKNTGYTSTVFDFPCKKAIMEWGGGSDYSKLTWAADGIDRPAGLMHHPSTREYAVTFIDNHDTASPHEGPWEFSGDIAKANAFLLSSPGIPCIFWKHWNSTHKAAIKQMIEARKKVGLHSNSDVRVTNKSGYYESKGIGACGELICRIGGNLDNVPSGYTKACSGNGWAYFTKLTSTECEDITDPGNNSDPIGSATIRFKAPEDWTSVKIWAWNAMDNTQNYTGGNWPGTAMSLDENGYYTITLSNVNASILGIVINNGNTTTDKQQTVDLTASGDICWKATSSTTESGTKKYSAVVDATCGEDPPIIDDAITVRVKSPCPIGNELYIYSWDGIDYPNATDYTGAWPGTKMNKDADGNFYYTFPKTIAEVYVIFTDGVAGEATVQTDDIQSIKSSTCFEVSTEKHPHMLSEKLVHAVNAINCDGTSSVEEPTGDVTLSIYPNPVENELHVSSDETVTRIEIMTATGSVVKSSANTSLHVADLPAGLYIIKVDFAGSTSRVMKFIKK